MNCSFKRSFSLSSKKYCCVCFYLLYNSWGNWFSQFHSNICFSFLLPLSLCLFVFLELCLLLSPRSLFSVSLAPVSSASVLVALVRLMTFINRTAVFSSSWFQSGWMPWMPVVAAVVAVTAVVLYPNFSKSSSWERQPITTLVSTTSCPRPGLLSNPNVSFSPGTWHKSERNTSRFDNFSPNVCVKCKCI